MNKRYIRIDIEYDNDHPNAYGPSYTTMHNLERIISEDMPYCRVLFKRDAPNREDLNESVNRR